MGNVSLYNPREVSHDDSHTALPEPFFQACTFSKQNCEIGEWNLKIHKFRANSAHYTTKYYVSHSNQIGCFPLFSRSYFLY